MTNEQREAIETMQHWIEYEKEHKDEINKANELIQIQAAILSLIKEQNKTINDLEYALIDMIMQFANKVNTKGSSYALNTMGLSALELAFDMLGFDDLYPVKKAEEKYKILEKQYFANQAKTDQ